MKLFVILLFAATYVAMIALPKWRYIVALASAAIMIVSGALPAAEAFGQIDWNVLMMLAGTMGTVSLFIASRMPERMADLLLKKTPNIMWVAVALAIATKLGTSPVPLLICIAVSSNLQGAATLVGDTTSIMLGGAANMNFVDFIFMDGKPGIFWAVELGALATVPVIMFIFHKERGRVTVGEPAKVEDYVPSVLLLGTVVLLIAASFIPERPALTNGFICMGVFVIGMIYTLVCKKNAKLVKNALTEIDFQTLLLLAGLFIVIGSLTYNGIIDDISQLLVNLGGSNLFLMYTLIVWASVLFSAFIDNIPYVATMLPVVAGIASRMGCAPHLLYFGLLVGATLGGNLTPIGASANIAAIGILRKAGYEVKTKEFLRIGVPFTLLAVLVGYLFCWFIWS